MHVAGSEPRLSPCGSSSARARRSYLRFSPLSRPAADPVEDINLNLSLASASLSLVSSPATELLQVKREEYELMKLSSPVGTSEAQQRRRLTSGCNSSVSSSTGSKHNRRLSQPTQSYTKDTAVSSRSSTILSDASSSFNSEYRRHGARRCTIQPLGEDEVALVSAAYKRYVQSIDKPGCLLVLLQELGAGHSSTECEVWLQQLESFFCTSRNRLVGSGVCTTEAEKKSDKSLGKQQRVLTEEEVISFATWLKTTHGEIFPPRTPPSPPPPPPPTPPPRRTSILVNGGKHSASSSSTTAATNNIPTAEGTTPLGDEKEPDFRFVCDGSTLDHTSSRRGRERRIKWDDARKASAPVSTTKGDSPLPRPTGKSPTSVSSHLPLLPPPTQTPTPSARGLFLERQAFTELGGNSDGSGAVRLIDLKRMLRLFHVEGNFNACVGQSIDVDRSGWINFEEFLWVLEHGVRGEGPAADIHANLTAPLNGGATSNQSPKRSVRTPHSPQKGKGNHHSTTAARPGRSNSLPAVLNVLSLRSSRRSTHKVRLPEVRSNSSQGREKTGGRPVTARAKLGAVEDLRKAFAARLADLSPYAEKVVLPRRSPSREQRHRARRQPHPPHRRSHMRSSHSPERSQTPRTKSSAAQVSHGNGVDKKMSNPRCDATAQKLHLLREQQTRLTKKLQLLTSPPLCDDDARQRSQKLQRVQNELNTVIDLIAATLCGATASEERGDRE